MTIDGLMADRAVLEELGCRLAHRRIVLEFTQQDLANEAGISKRTLERLEAGQSSQLLTVIRVLRALDMLDLLEVAIPEATTRPMDLLRLKGKQRQRVSAKKKKQLAGDDWSWGE